MVRSVLSKECFIYFGLKLLINWICLVFGSWKGPNVELHTAVPSTLLVHTHSPTHPPTHPPTENKYLKSFPVLKFSKFRLIYFYPCIFFLPFFTSFVFSFLSYCEKLSISDALFNNQILCSPCNRSLYCLFIIIY